MGRFFWVHQNMTIIWIMIVLVQMNGCRSRSCIEKERKGLLELKAFYNASVDWSTKSDCCQWDGIKCDRTSGRVIGLSSFALGFPEPYSLLNLSLLRPFEELRELDLSSVGFGGLSDSIEELKNLANLEVLDLSYNHFNDSRPMQGLFDLNKLKALDLSDNNFFGSPVPEGLCKLKNLRELDLCRNGFVGQVPLCFGSLKNLRLLDLSSNQLGSKVPSIFSALESLEYLSLSKNRFEGLFSLDSLANLSRLKVIRLSSQSNKLQIIETKIPWQPNLTIVELPHCNLEKFPSFLLYQKYLRLVDLSNNRLSGNFPTWLLENNTGLKVLSLSKNSFRSLQLPKLNHNLRVLDVSANDFDDFLPGNFGKVLPDITHMNLSKNGFQGNLPSSLGEMKNISFLDISHNNFYGELPKNFVMGCYSLTFLVLSHNKFSGQIFPKSMNLSSLMVLNMNNNKFSGTLGDGFFNLSSLIVLDISNNFLNGTIPRWLGNLTSLSRLVVANNLLEGAIPDSVFHLQQLRFLDFSNNKLSGTLPWHSNSGAIYKRMFYFNDNDFDGSIPETLLENVRLLDVRNNKLSGIIPQFIDTQNISILLLRGNNLEGHIPKSLCELSNIKVLDLADNKLSGSIPSCLNNISFGLGKDAGQYYYDDVEEYVPMNAVYEYYGGSMLRVDKFSIDYEANLQGEIMFLAKQRYDSYKGEALKFMFGLDLSSNQLSGEIPIEFGDLKKLRALNLSHNYLSGPIPQSFSNMKDMESLDLRFNGLSGRIPLQLTRLDYLSVFNVSYNNLSGAIPQESPWMKAAI